jgi:pimeloyl-ACP methyl ester carboxylesterase
MAAINCVRKSIPVLNHASRFIMFYDYGVKSLNPAVMYVPGFQGSGHGLKSQSIGQHCLTSGLRYVCYDPEATGESKVENILSLEFKHWFEDAEAALIKASEDGQKVLLIGSSMGGWISLTLANRFPNVVAGLLLISPAVNFLRPKYQIWYDQAGAEAQKDQDNGKVAFMDPSYAIVPIRKDFVAKSSELEIDLSKCLEIKCPVKIIHGVQDDTIPFKNSLDVMNVVSGSDVELIYKKDGDHRMQNESGLELIMRTLDVLVKQT